MTDGKRCSSCPLPNCDDCPVEEGQTILLMGPQFVNWLCKVAIARLGTLTVTDRDNGYLLDEYQYAFGETEDDEGFTVSIRRKEEPGAGHAD